LKWSIHPDWTIIISSGRKKREAAAMELSLALFIFLSALGLCVFLYALHFRRRALSLGPDRLTAALSRTVPGEEEADDEELWQGAAELDSRLRFASTLSFSLLIAVLACCLVLLITSTLPELSLALTGLCVLLLAIALSLRLLRDIILEIGVHLDDQVDGAPDPE
jgi:hypothetical protein